ncbi:HEPN domain-containing protein [Pelistega europaea]|uniref:HEPN domain-containing protein n=1 Tax=Pelistega europaea TaxID=106147 RepID=A0A7Y4L8B9_9BURK|nr:HEPN domain-containing protein [Pelistega europaea]NOL48844.1 HEPN domain-containing protein [Pelistega europaea]
MDALKIEFKKSQDCLKIAHLSFDVGEYDSAVNRAYYSILHTIRCGLLLSNNPEAASNRTHSGLISAFFQFLIKENLIDQSFSKKIGRAYEYRLISDYSGDFAEKDEALSCIQTADELLEAIKKLGMIS